MTGATQVIRLTRRVNFFLDDLANLEEISLVSERRPKVSRVYFLTEDLSVFKIGLT